MKTGLPKRKITVTDVIMIFVLGTAAIISVFLFRNNEKSDYVHVSTTEGAFSLDLSEDTEKTVSSNGYGYTLKVENGQISVTEASCPDKTCRSMKPLSRDNDGAIICVPGKLLIEKSDETEKCDADIIIP